MDWPSAPRRHAEHQRKQRKENTRDLKPEDSADPAEGTQETTHAACNSARGLARNLPGSTRLGAGHGS